MIYFNNASTTPVLPEVIEEITNVLTNNWGNPSDALEFGHDSKMIIEEAKQVIAKKINAKPEEIIFTPSGCASNTLAINGVCKNGLRCMSSKIEHSSILNNDNVDAIIPVSRNGVVDFDEFSDIVSTKHNKYRVISVMAANNELGSTNDIKKLVRIAKEHGLLFHTDATQYFPYLPIDVKEWGVDMMTLSGHKIGAPSGIAVLYVKSGTPLNKSLVYGSQQNGLLAGTENVAYIAGLRKAVECMNDDDANRVYQIRYRFEKSLLEAIPSVRINGALRTPHISNVYFPGCDGQEIQTMLDAEEIMVSTGSACNAHKKVPSNTLLSIGMTPEEALSCVRFSFYHNNTVEEVEQTVKTLKVLTEVLR